MKSFSVPNIPPVSVSVMVVEDDATTLAIVSGLLRVLKYEVMPFKDPLLALSTLWERKYCVDIIVTDLHMPNMNGFELQKRVDDAFKLPVIMISSDDRENMILRAIGCGIALYLVKPVSLNDLKNIWQYAIANKKGKKPMIAKEIGTLQEESSTGAICNEDVNSVSSTNERRRERRRSSKQKENRKGKGGLRVKRDVIGIIAPTRKQKVVWTDALQNRFLHAVHFIGLDRAVPKKILEVMNVSGLTRENVASHLQKYRLFLRRVAENCRRALQLYNSSSGKTIMSNLTSSHANSLILKKIQQEFPRFIAQQQKARASSSKPRNNRSSNCHFLNPKPKNPSSHVLFPTQLDVSKSTVSTPQFGYGQSSFHHYPFFMRSTNPLHQPSSSSSASGIASNTSATTWFPHEGFPYGQDAPKTGTNSRESDCRSFFGTPEVRYPNYYPSIPDAGSSNGVIPTPQNSMGNGGEIGMGKQMQNYGNVDISNNNGLVDGIYSGNKSTIEAIGDGTSGCLDGGNFFEIHSENYFSPTEIGKEDSLVALSQLQVEQCGIETEGENSWDPIFDALNSIDISKLEEFNKGDDSAGDFLIGKLINLQDSNELQGWEEVVNPILSEDVNMQNSENVSVDQQASLVQGWEEITNSIFFEDISLQKYENVLMDQSSLVQNQCVKELEDVDFSGMMSALDEYAAVPADQNPSQEEGGRGLSVDIFALDEMHFPDKIPPGTPLTLNDLQGWEMEFVDSMFGTNNYMEE